MSVRILIGDCRDRLRTLPAESVNCIVTSPPYFGLRDYGVDGQLGLEATPSEFVTTMVEVFREARRVLRDDGTLWLNLGDSYAGSWGAQGHRIVESDDPSWHSSQIKNHPKRARQTGTIREAGLKPKDLIGIPWRVAFALQADGWYLRQDIIWSKPNPMPESVQDRCTKAHEYLFLLSKSERYHYDAAAIAEAVAPATIERLSQPNIDAQAGSDRVPGKTNGAMKALPPRFGGSKYGDDETEQSRTKSGNAYEIKDGKRNKRSVWTVATQPFKEAHFATFPPALIEPCILAGCPVGETVLDPFGGAGTTGLVADRLGRDAILIELNPAYAAMAEERIRREQPMFADVSTEAA
jgi:DNA modification methylase